jgi:hypothetical protein
MSLMAKFSIRLVSCIYPDKDNDRFREYKETWKNIRIILSQESHKSLKIPVQTI